MNKDALSSARQVLAIESKALESLAANLDEGFIKAVEIISNLKGRVILTGMGKSGHVAKKMAATLASTGSPSFFVHPAEASHGDLGMITPDDAIIALSNSGETPELGDIIAYSRRFAIPLIGIIGNRQSFLATACDAAIVLPEAPEACPLGLAPTTSTTMMLALGDALEVALLEKKGFSRDDFRLRHPGGKLGKSLIKVSDLMHSGSELPIISENILMREALIIMSEKSFGCLCVVDIEQKILGIITDGDLRRKMSSNLLELSVYDVMTANPKTIRAEALAAEALHIMNSKKITSLFVANDEGRAVGIVHIHDCLRAGIM